MLLVCIASVSADSLYKFPSECTEVVCWMNETSGNGPSYYSVDDGTTWTMSGGFLPIVTPKITILGISVRNYTLAEDAVESSYSSGEYTAYGYIVYPNQVLTVTYVPSYGGDTVITSEFPYPDLLAGELTELTEGKVTYHPLPGNLSKWNSDTPQGTRTLVAYYPLPGNLSKWG